MTAPCCADTGRLTIRLSSFRMRKKQQTAELVADDARDRQRLREPQRQRGHGVGLNAQRQVRLPFDELTIGIHDRVDVVVDDVVAAQVVLVVRGAARREHRRRCVERNSAFARAVEKRDVFGVAAAAGVGERAELVGADLREEVADLRQDVPRFAAEIAEIDVERLRRLRARRHPARAWPDGDRLASGEGRRRRRASRSRRDAVARRRRRTARSAFRCR